MMPAAFHAGDAFSACRAAASWGLALDRAMRGAWEVPGRKGGGV